jgi:hypothetical protein
LWLWASLDATSAFDQRVGWDFVEGMAKTLLPFLAGITMIDSMRQLKQLAWVLMLSQG